jgi:hypothetical protein
MAIYVLDTLFTLTQKKIHVLITSGVILTIHQLAVRQPANLPNSKTQNSSFPCTAAFSAQHCSQPQPATASPNKQALRRFRFHVQNFLGIKIPGVFLLQCVPSRMSCVARRVVSLSLLSRRSVSPFPSFAAAPRPLAATLTSLSLPPLHGVCHCRPSIARVVAAPP